MGTEQPFEPGATIGDYRLVRLLGRGGMGEVYLARDQKLGRRVAIKVVRRERVGAVDAVERFLREARSTAALNHPNIVTVYGVGEHDGQPFLALEYVEGETLRERLRASRPGVRAAARIGLAIASALEAAHRAELVHRDLKPENVILGADGRLRVLDFGLARPARDARPDAAGAPTSDRAASSPVGTRAYMAPETWRADGTYQRASDVWALGVILYELLCGRRPFLDAESAPVLLAARVGAGSVPSLTALVEAVPPELDDVVARCLAVSADERPLASELVHVLGGLLSDASAHADVDSPYRGLLPFTEQHASLFFGRRDEVAWLAERLREEPFLAVVGPSGAGKSSLVHAGLVPRLREEGAWQVITLRPGHDPLATLSSRLTTGDTATFGDTFITGDLATAAAPGEPLPHDLASVVREHLQESPGRLGVQLAGIAEASRGRLLLVVDQLEEVCTHAADAAAGSAFLEAIASAAGDVEEPVRVVVTLRDDFLGRLAVGPQIRRALGRVAVVRTPAAASLRECLVRPLELVGYRFEDDELVDDIVAELGEGPAGLPLLQFTARMLWERRDRGRRVLTRAAYTDMGGVGGALAEHADGVLRGLRPDELREAHALLLRLVTPSGTRRVLTRAEAIEGIGAAAPDILDRFVDARIVTSGRADGAGDASARVELVHEALLEAWGTLRRWVDESREELVFLEQIEQAAELWEDRGRRREEVWTGDALAEARRMVARGTTPISRRAGAFMAAGTSAEQRTSRRRRVAAVGGVLLLVLVALGSLLGAWALAEREAEATHQRDLAVSARALAEREAARAAYARGERLVARAQLRSALETADADSPGTRLLWWQLRRDPLVWAYPTAAQTIYGVDFSPDGRTVAAATSDRTIRLIDVVSRSDRVLRGHPDHVLAVSWSPTGEQIASADWSSGVWLWDVRTGGHIVLSDPDSRNLWVDFSPDGTLLAGAGNDGLVRVWRVAEPAAEPQRLRGHRTVAARLAFSSQGRLVSSGSRRDRRILVWNLEDGTVERAIDPGDLGSPGRMSFHPDGRRLVTAARDGRIVVWDTDTGELVLLIRGHDSDVQTVDFTIDGERILSSGVDGALRLWEAATGRAAGVIRTPIGNPSDLAVSPDGRYAALGGSDGALRLWDLRVPLRRPRTRPHEGAVSSVAFDPQSARLASVGEDGMIRIWDTQDGRTRRVVKAHDGVAQALSWTPDGRYLVTAGADRRVRVWDAQNWRKRAESALASTVVAVAVAPAGDAVFAGIWHGTVWRLSLASDGMLGTPTEVGKHDGGVYDIAPAADGRRLATASSDKTVRVFSVDGGAATHVLRGHEEAVRGVAWAGPGRLVSGSEDGTVRRWDLATGSATILGRCPKRAYWLHVSPKGVVAIPCADGSVRLVHVDRPGEVRVLRGHRNEVGRVRFDPTGELLASVSDDGSVRLWHSETGRAAWSAPALIDGLRLIAGGRWWTLGLLGAAVADAPPEAPWAPRVLSSAHASADTAQLCVADANGAVELYDRQRRVLVGAAEVPGLRDLRAAPTGCVALGEGGAILLTAGGRVQPLAQPAAAIAVVSDRVLVAAGAEVLEWSSAGAARVLASIGPGVSALAADEERVFAGHENGGIEIVHGVSNPPTFTGVSAAPVTRLSTGTGGVLVAGFADGAAGIWDPATGARIHRERLHGAVVHIAHYGPRLVVASDLGDWRVLDLSVLGAGRCELLAEVWAQVPVTWRRGRAVAAEAPAQHPCASVGMSPAE